MDYSEAAELIVDVLGPNGACDLLRILEVGSASRAVVYRELYERGGHAALLDVLADLEADPILRGVLVEHLRLQLERV